MSVRPFPLIECCPECGDDTYLSFPSAQPGAPDFGEYECPAGHSAYIPERVNA